MSRKPSKYRKSLEELVKENKQELLNNKQEMERIENLIEKRHELKRLA